MKEYYEQIIKDIQSELELIDMGSFSLSIDECSKMVDILEKRLEEMRTHFLSSKDISTADEIHFFKEIKPKVLGFLLYFNKIHIYHLKCPNGSNETVKKYYQKELDSLTHFFDRNIDFYQYYRSNSTYFDEQYFTRNKRNRNLGIDSAYFVMDPDFSTAYDFKITKIISNEMLRIYLNKKLNSIEKQLIINKSRSAHPLPNLIWTGNKVALVELGYSLNATKYINRGNTDIKEIMQAFEIIFNVDLGDYYRTFIDIKERKINRTKYLNYLIECLIKRMDEDEN